MVLGKSDRYFHKNETKLLSYAIVKNTFKWIKILNVRPKTIKILEENKGSKISDFAQRYLLSYTPPQARETKEKINKWDYIKQKSFCTAKDQINKIKRQPTEWENIFTNTSGKGLIFKSYKELTKLNTINTNNPMKKGAKA